MYYLNRDIRYNIIRGLITEASVEKIEELVRDSGFAGLEEDDDIETRRGELLYYIDELYKDWNENHIDLIDRQYIIIEDDGRCK